MTVISFHTGWCNLDLDNPKQNIYVRGHGAIKVALLGIDETAEKVLHRFVDQSCTSNGSLSQLAGEARHRIQACI